MRQHVDHLGALQHDEVPSEFNAALLRFIPGAVDLTAGQRDVQEQYALSSAADL